MKKNTAMASLTRDPTRPAKIALNLTRDPTRPNPTRPDPRMDPIRVHLCALSCTPCCIAASTQHECWCFYAAAAAERESIQVEF